MYVVIHKKATCGGVSADGAFTTEMDDEGEEEWEEEGDGEEGNFKPEVDKASMARARSKATRSAWLFVEYTFYLFPNKALP